MRFLCIHGHFYQPPRENAWLEAIEQQDSAYPYHDWNERITAECYAPNGASRILDAENRIVKIVNNYAGINFNFGPTLLSWLAENVAETYRDILAADRASVQRFSGHGSAMAQCYSHMIMPLANARDKFTQVYWGLQDFRFRFGRDPEGMWLPETAVDLETLDIMAQQGISYTVLAPSQAKSVDGEDVSGGRIDTTCAYTVKLPSGRSMSLFFYNGPVSRAVAFEHLLDNGENFARRLLTSFTDESDRPQLAHIATDGETYGHHHRYGDMALSYALGYIESNGLARITNYAEFLALHPPEHVVEIFENTAWSCVHDVGRWSRNCSCNSGGRGDWNQEWRAPLRAALDWLRDEVAPRFETAAARYLKDPWAARNEYIDVILDRAPESRDHFGARHFRRKNLQRADRVHVWKLLELQRHAMLMYTSCGWFFDELSGIETVQVIQYAGRVVQLAQELFDDSIEQRFLEKLLLAKSNIPEHRDGAHIYMTMVKPAMVDMLKLGAHYAITSLFEPMPEDARVYCFEVDSKDYRLKRSGKMRLALGRARCTSRITQESEMLMFGVVHFGDHNLHGGVSLFSNDEAYRDLGKAVRDAFTRSDVPDTIHLIDQSFGGHTYSLRNLFRDEQRKILNEILKPALRGIESAYRQLYDNYAPLLRFMHDCRIPVPYAMKITAEIALNGMLRRALESGELNLELIQSILEDMRTAGGALDETALEMSLRRHLERNAQHFFRNPLELDQLRRLREQVAAAKSLPLPLVLWSLQNLCYDILEKVYPEMLEKGEMAWAAEFRRLAELLSLKI